ncbi:hypothetical protein GCM10020255_018440 [Rhodococcus baikonurensis]
MFATDAREDEVRHLEVGEQPVDGGEFAAKFQFGLGNYWRGGGRRAHAVSVSMSSATFV